MAPFAADWEAPAEAELAWGPCHGRLIRLIRRPSRCSRLHRTEQSSLQAVARRSWRKRDRLLKRVSPCGMCRRGAHPAPRHVHRRRHSGSTRAMDHVNQNPPGHPLRRRSRHEEPGACYFTHGPWPSVPHGGSLCHRTTGKLQRAGRAALGVGADHNCPLRLRPGSCDARLLGDLMVSNSTGGVLIADPRSWDSWAKG
jgi:hypothetical protein